jgi:hypothetical protein
MKAGECVVERFKWLVFDSRKDRVNALLRPEPVREKDSVLELVQPRRLAEGVKPVPRDEVVRESDFLITVNAAEFVLSDIGVDELDPCRVLKV